MAKIGIMDLFTKEPKEAPATEVVQNECKHSDSVEPVGGSAETDSAETSASEEEAVANGGAQTDENPRPTDDSAVTTDDAQNEASKEVTDEAQEPNGDTDSEAQKPKVEKATGKAEKNGWVDWEIGLNSRFLVADISGEDGFFGSPSELLPFAFRIFEALLKDGKNEDKKSAHGALKFLTENYQSFPAQSARPPISKPDIVVPESLKEVAQSKNDPAAKPTKARLPIPALGYFDLNGRVRSYKEWKDAGNPDDWDEEVVWKFDDVWSNITVPIDIAQGFYDGKSYDSQVDHDFARKAQAALQEWLNKKRRR